MHIHILGICGTFMGGIAQLAREAGHRVTGCDRQVYPPMSTALENAGIEIVEGYAPEQLDQFDPDLWVVGNAIGRGNPLLEALLDRGLPYTSGPQWLSEYVLRGRRVLAVAGTHGKTTTTSMLAWILKDQGLNPGFLVGGVPSWSERSAVLGDPNAPFVIEADEYDTAFCDKRSKFVHYRPYVAILNNLEYDHADIFPDLAAIETQFHHLVRTIPASGRVIVNAGEAALARVLDRGCWTPVEYFNGDKDWVLSEANRLSFNGNDLGELNAQMPGRYNALNATAAVAAAAAIGVEPQNALVSLSNFAGVKRRQEIKGEVAGIRVIDDFAHHPTAIDQTLNAVADKAPGRVLAILEPRSNTMKLGTMKDRLAAALTRADRVFCFKGAGVKWDPADALAPLGAKAFTTDDFDALLHAILSEAKPTDTLLCMSNGGFNGIHGKLLGGLKARWETAQ